MNKLLKNKAVIIIILLAVAAGLWAWKYNNNRQPPKTEKTERQLNVLPLPKAFPADLPVGEVKDLTFNSEIKVENGTVYTRRFNTEKPPQESFNGYKTYLAQHGWTITKEVDSKDGMFLFSKKDKDVLNLTFSKTSQNGKYWVNVSYTYQP